MTVVDADCDNVCESKVFGSPSTLRMCCVDSQACSAPLYGSLAWVACSETWECMSPKA